MNIELYLILSATYIYMLEHEGESKVGNYIVNGIETYFHKQGYTYDVSQKEWTTQAKLDEIARNRTQGAKVGWEIRRGKQRSKNDKELL